jgi:hypothetical protein
MHLAGQRQLGRAQHSGDDCFVVLTAPPPYVQAGPISHPSVERRKVTRVPGLTESWLAQISANTIRQIHRHLAVETAGPQLADCLRRAQSPGYHGINVS